MAARRSGPTAEKNGRKPPVFFCSFRGDVAGSSAPVITTLLMGQVNNLTSGFKKSSNGFKCQIRFVHE